MKRKLLECASVMAAVILASNGAAVSATSRDASLPVSVSMDQALTVTLAADEIAFNTQVGTFNSQATSVTVTSNNPTGVTLNYTTSQTTNALQHENAIGATIDALSADVTCNSDCSNFTKGQWGVALNSSSAGNAVFKSVPGSGSTPAEAIKTTVVGSATQNFVVGARAADDQAAGKYVNTIVFTAVTNPLPVTWDTMTTMQEMTPEICASQPTPAANASNVPTKQLIDERDSKTYWIAKLADGNCWMTQNLDLNLSTSKALTPEDSDVSTKYTPAINTSTSVFDSFDNTAQNSYDGGNYYWNGQWDGGGDSGSGYGNFSKFSTTKPASQGDHYHVGNLYQWNAATAGTGGSTITSAEATSSICPKGWRLPLSNSTDNYSFSKLLSAYSATSDTSKIIASPLFFVPAGYVVSGSLNSAGDIGNYWETSVNSSRNAYNLNFNSTNLNPANNNNKGNGFTVRCVAR